MSYTIENQVNNYFNKHGYDFDTYMTVLEDLETMATAANECNMFTEIYDECVKQMTILERIVKEKFNSDGERIKDD